MNYKPIYEFLVWDNCKNNCKFCFQRENPRLFNHSKKEIILNEVINFINSDKFIKGSHILVCGGEIFDTPNDFKMLDDFFKKIVNLMLNNIINLLYINTNLIYNNIDGLKNLLSLIQKYNLFNRFKFTTSYDLEGRFKTNDDKQLMLNNLIYLKNNYNNLNIVVNTILTKEVCSKIISKEFKLSDFMNKYQCWINLIPYIIYDKKLSASRNEIFKALRIVNDDCIGYLSKYVPNISIEQDKFLYMYKDNNFQFCSCKIDKCGHSENFKKYSEQGTCFCCDLKEVFGELI